MATEWKKVRLGELYEVHNGLSKGGKFFGSGYPFLSFSTIFNNFFIPENIKDLVQSTPEEQGNYSVKAGDVFVTRTSETADELGMSCVALKDYPNATYNGFCKRLRPIDTEYTVLPKYIGYYLRTPEFRGKFLGLSGSMTTRASLKNDDLLSMTIPLPPLETQQKIAGILSAYDDLIENNRKQIKLLEEAAQKLYKEWFVKLNFPGHENVKIVDGVPEGWKILTVEDLIGKLESGSRPKGGIDWTIKKGIASVGAENVIGLGQYNYSSEKFVNKEFYENAKRGKIEDKDILIYKDGAYIGRTSLFQDNFPHKEAMINEHVFLLHAREESNQYFLFFTLYQRTYFEKMQKLNKNAAQPGINQDAIKSLKFLMPAEQLIREFDNFVTPIIKRIFVLAKQNSQLQSTRDKLLPRLMNREI